MPHATAGHSPSGIASVAKEREREKRRERERLASRRVGRRGRARRSYGTGSRKSATYLWYTTTSHVAYG